MEIPKTIVLISALLSILYFRTFIWLVNSWLTDPYYLHGFLIPIICGFIAWQNIREGNKGGMEEDKLNPEPVKPGIYIVAFGIALHTFSVIKLSPFLSALSFLVTASGLILYFYGKPLMRSFLFPISFFIFAIPLPFVFLEKVAYSLQSLSAYYPALFIGMLGIPVTRIGADIQLNDASFFIGLPCSGMNSIIALLALTTVFVYILRCPVYKKIVVLSVAIPIAIFANILRITSLLLIANAYGAEIADRFFHALFSPLLFIIAFIFLIFVSILIGCEVTGRGE
ncbi:MAG: exosortase [Nitrospiraceae bacterium]|nr:exosortase [Nitrospiraceae bacterium]